MRERESITDISQDACRAGIFYAVFRLTAIAELYGPKRALDWAQSLLDDPELLTALARAGDGSPPVAA